MVYGKLKGKGILYNRNKIQQVQKVKQTRRFIKTNKVLTFVLDKLIVE